MSHGFNMMKGGGFPPSHGMMSQINMTELSQIYNATSLGTSTLGLLMYPNTYLLTLKWFMNTVVAVMFGNDFFAAGILLMIINSMIATVQRLIWKILSFMGSKFVSSVTIPSHDESYQWVLKWLSHKGYTQSCQDLEIQSSWNKRGRKAGLEYARHRHPRHSLREDDKKRPDVLLAPADGTHFFTFKGRLVWFYRGQRKSSSFNLNPFNQMGNARSSSNEEQQDIVLYIIGISPKETLLSIIDDACELNYLNKDKKTTIYTAAAEYRGCWESSTEKNTRELDSVILPSETKAAILNDIQAFRDNEEWYRQCGVPYRRGVLFYGPPGTGKSSTIVALAGKLEMNVCIISLSSPSMSDERLQELMNQAPLNSLFLLEDVDSAFKTREEPVAPVDELNRSRFHPRMPTGITFAGVLNAIDGVNAQEGRILFMTTNHLDKLDPALIRPGRVDLRIHFALATQEQIKNLFIKFFPSEVEVASELSQLIPDQTLTPAQLQGFFLAHRQNPKDAIKDLPQFLEECAMQNSKPEEISAPVVVKEPKLSKGSKRIAKQATEEHVDE